MTKIEVARLAYDKRVEGDAPISCGEEAGESRLESMQVVVGRTMG